MFKKLVFTGLVVVMVMGIASSVFAEVGTHGFILARSILTNNNYTARIERFGIKFSEKIDDEFDWVTEIYIHPQQPAGQGRLYLESAYLNWNLQERVPWDFSVRIGRGRNYCYGQTPSYGRRRTSDYSLYSEVFTQLRVVGFQTFSNFGENIQLAVALINPYTNSGRFLPDFPVGDNIRIPISDRDTESSTFNRVALSGRLGYKNELFNVGGNLYISDPEEGTGAKSRFGLDGEVKLENGILAQAQVTMAKSSIDVPDYVNKVPGAGGILVPGSKGIQDVNHMGGEVLVGWEQDKVGLYARYGMVSFDDEMQALNSIMLSAVYKILPRIHFRLEGLINGEDDDTTIGVGEIDNNVLFFETLFAW